MSIRICTALLTLLLGFSVAQAQEITSTTWLHDIEEAQTLAAEQDRPILMVFAGSDWCKPCILMKRQIWSNPAFEAYASESLVLLELDFPARKKNALSPDQVAHNEKLAEQYNPKGLFPQAVLVDAEGKELMRFGYTPRETPEEVVKKLSK